jgi:hypothetical protein
MARLAVAVPLCLGLVASGGCGVAATLGRTMDGRREGLQYPPRTAPPVEPKDGATLRVGKVTAVGIPPGATQVKLVRWFVLPLLVLNGWEESWRCELGRAQIANDPESFLRASLVEELQRGSRHPLVSGSADLELEVTVTKVEASAPIDQGLMLLLVYNTASGRSWLRAGPVVSSIEAEVVLRKGTEAPRLLKILGQAQVAVPPDAEGRTDLDFVVPALVDGLSAAIQDLNRKIVEAIDAPPDAA